jgi:hypothetical protein
MIASVPRNWEPSKVNIELGRCGVVLTSVRLLAFDKADGIKARLRTHVETEQICAIAIERRVVEIGELLCNCVYVSHGKNEVEGKRWLSSEKIQPRRCDT